MKIKNHLWEDIQAQADNLRHVTQHLLIKEQSQVEKAAQFLQNEKPIVFVGIASAAYLCEPASIFLQQNGRPSTVLAASHALYNAIPSLKNSNVILNSRSGETVEIVKLSKVLFDKGIPFVLITNEPDSTAAGLAKHVIWCNSRKDDLVSINIVTGMMTATLILAATVLGKLSDLAPSLEQLPNALDRVIRISSGRAKEIQAFFLNTRPIYLLYRGNDKGAAYCSRLVLEEVARHPAVAIEAGEFRQGPIEVVDLLFGAVLFIPKGVQGELNLTLAKNIIENEGRVLLIGNCSQEDLPNQLVIPIFNVPNELLPVLIVAPIQVLAYELAAYQGFAPGQVRYISKIITTEEGIPNQQ